jgi:hypothetical protein
MEIELGIGNLETGTFHRQRSATERVSDRIKFGHGITEGDTAQKHLWLGCIMYG